MIHPTVFEASISSISPLVTQGDLLELHTRQLSGQDQIGFGIVVTGECDIAQNKYSGIFSYVELFEVEVYALRFVIRPELERLRDVIPSVVIDRLKEAPSLKELEPNIAYHRLIEAGSIPLTLDLGPLKDLAESARLVLAKIDGLLNSKYKLSDVNEDLSLVSGLAKKLGHKPKSITLNSICDKLVSDIGDAFYIGELPDQDDARYIASLRLLREIHRNQVVVSPSQLRNLSQDCGKYAIKRQRLGVPYRYKLTQKLGAVFSDIGLPAEFEDNRTSNLRKIFA